MLVYFVVFWLFIKEEQDLGDSDLGSLNARSLVNPVSFAQSRTISYIVLYTLYDIIHTYIYISVCILLQI